MYQTPYKIFSSILLMILITGCNQSTPSRSSAVRVVSSQPTQSTGLMVSAWGTNCVYYSGTQDLLSPGLRGNVVLSTDPFVRSEYDNGELQQITAWAQSYYNRGSNNNLPTSSLPKTLQWSQGGLVAVSGWPIASETGCYGLIRLVNTGQSPIQIQSLDVRLATIPQPNKIQYYLVDICSLLKIGDCTPGRAGPGPLTYHAQLSPGNTGKIFLLQGNPTQGLDRTQIILYPEDVIDIEIFFDSSPTNLIYSIVPDIVYSTTGEHQATLSLSESTLYFADPSHFSCYALRGDIFVNISKVNNASWQGWCI